MSRPRVAVIGAGHLGSIHARLLAQRTDVRLAGVVDPSPDARRKLIEKLDVPTLSSVEELSDDVEAAIVATPTTSHCKVALALLERGVHIFVEKPIAARSVEARALCRAARRHDRVLQVGHSERFNGAWLAAYPFLRDCRHIRASRTSGFPSRSLDVGVVLDLMIHEIDLILSLTDAPVVDLSAHAAVVVGPHEDVVSARIEFADGLVVELESSRVSPWRRRRWEVLTREGLVEIDFAEPAVSTALAEPSFGAVARQVAHWPYRRRQEFAEQLFHRWMPHRRLPVVPVNAIEREHDEFLAAIRGDGSVTVDGEAACRAVELAERIVAACGEPMRLDGGTAAPEKEAA